MYQLSTCSSEDLYKRNMYIFSQRHFVRRLFWAAHVIFLLLVGSFLRASGQLFDVIFLLFGLVVSYATYQKTFIYEHLHLEEAFAALSGTNPCIFCLNPVAESNLCAWAHFTVHKNRDFFPSQLVWELQLPVQFSSLSSSYFKGQLLEPGVQSQVARLQLGKIHSQNAIFLEVFFSVTGWFP